METEKRPAWAGFDVRLWAFVVDGFPVGIAWGLVFVGLMRRPQDLVHWMWIAQVAIFVAYFGWLSSARGGGATLGQRWLGTKVTDLEGRPIGLVRSLLRALVLAAPFAMNGLHLRIASPVLQWAWLSASFLALGLHIAQIYLLLFNSPSRRLVHDLATGTAVVYRTGCTSKEDRSARHIPIAAAVAVLVPFAMILLRHGPR